MDWVYTEKNAASDYIELPKTNKWMMTSAQNPFSTYLPAAWVYWIGLDKNTEKYNCIKKVEQPKHHLIEPINFIFLVTNVHNESSANSHIIEVLDKAGFSSIQSIFHTGGYATYFNSPEGLSKQLSLTPNDFLKLFKNNLNGLCETLSIKNKNICKTSDLLQKPFYKEIELKLKELCSTVYSSEKDIPKMPLTFADKDYKKGGDHFRLLGPYQNEDGSYIYTASISEESAFNNNKNCKCGHIYVSFTEAKRRLAEGLINSCDYKKNINLYTTNLFNVISKNTDKDYPANQVFFTGDHQKETNNLLSELTLIAVLNNES